MSVTKEELLSQKIELQESITETARAAAKQATELQANINKTALEAAKQAEKRRNEALGVFAAIAVLLSILGYFGLQQIVSKKVDDMGANAILEKAKNASTEIEKHQNQAAESAKEMTNLLSKTEQESQNQKQKITDLIASFEQINAIQECRVCFQETEGSSQCQGNRSSCSGWSKTPNWSAKFRDDTDKRSGGCKYQWKLECR